MADDQEPDWEAMKATALQNERWTRERYIELAAKLGVTLVDELDPDEYRGTNLVYRSKIEGRKTVHVIREGWRWRISEMLIDGALYGRGWCFPIANFSEMILALKAWDCDPHSEPEGWFKRFVPEGPAFAFAERFFLTGEVNLDDTSLL